jgi:hypothetical protein
MGIEGLSQEMAEFNLSRQRPGDYTPCLSVARNKIHSLWTLALCVPLRLGAFA